MQYHIQTTPIWDAFKSETDCPLCAIFERSSERLIEQYLNEAVMEPDYRVRVNKLGFCDFHLKKLFNGKNKLGLALQLHTHTQSLLNDITVIDNIKQSKKQVEKLSKRLSTCVICEELDEMMARYAYTIAQMYREEKDFASMLKASKGFCMPHYILLLSHAAKAGSKTSEYLNDLSGLQLSSLSLTNHNTQLFTQKFDYRNAGSGNMADAETVPSAIKKIRGRIL